ncbi:MAG: type I glyceraldehyde-3-phosphate dehydrogenase [SAR86 cluster bacterium]|uniref:Glyceraldehyde-3-phosphate dehydrogenase n=1 Tax=SAR86 cluster bacterium TaxID=2030880 RepID=A0A2A4MSI4_9GAMM|nr:MAG: type I glyceraldehyde-3-phosphate dehydrogenase [SAR86 cluster bacterium]
MSYRIAINGFGRIGRCVLRALYESRIGVDNAAYDGLEIVAINDLADVETLAYLTRYDSTHGRFVGEVETGKDALIVNSDEIRVCNTRNISELPWQELDIDLVMECSGSFSDRATAEQHLHSGAKRLLFSQPAENAVKAAVFGINHLDIELQDRIISNASCTTNCIVPVIKCLDEGFGLESGMITTIHSAMNDQPVIDAYHHSDLRKTRSAMQSIIPVDTEIAKGIGRILPHMQGRFEGQALRVPTVNVSAIDLTVTLNKHCSVEDLNAAIKSFSKTLPANVLGYTQEPLASCDFNHDPRSAVVDLSQTRVVAGSKHNLARVLTWFDNEWAYANRMLDVAQYLRKLTAQ